MGSFNRDDRSTGGYQGGFSRGGGRPHFSRQGRDSRGGGFGDRGDRPMYKATCSNCGKECEVPFRPTNGKPVYCSDCFEKMGGGRSDSPRPERNDFRAPAPSFDQNKAQFDALNAKLDKILSLLEPKISAPAVPAPVVKDVKETKETKSPKVKKTTSTKK